ncbi:NAD-dependent epimerase/dehydratase family protein [Clavibacter zhangzhiyongii]|jgi:nucleoside-diphosphate-sugar epimerase|uniref:NAD-dependent epimerase/dehydratase family protein n=1 Tax=Clavibacter zhangzhiyongii TaxID=2768071 RepID=A0A7L7YYZ8_9MICO|nr:NAD-dependent epimerase/dehydratase family protein [Clavibacter zhangzhiyongii]QOD42685.1 NAD-dependent epimerase/dehydratase family protein [Clavibacter zhangzhiyongii]
MRVVVIGATGHIGTFLVPRLVESGHDVVAVSRGTREPYRTSPLWDRVERVRVDRDAEDAAGTFADRIADLAPEVVVDLVCFTPESARHLVEGLRGRVRHLVHIGSIWTHGLSTSLPLREDDPKEPFGDYGVRKAEIERYLIAESRGGGVPSTVVHPGHISGGGWPVITPLGNLDPAVWTALATGGPLAVPGSGSETMHHVHADDVAQVVQLAIANRETSVGESFHAVSERALSVRGFARAAAAWFGREPRLEHLDWDGFRARTEADHADASWEHLSRSHVASIDKARDVLGYAPRYTSEEAAREAVEWMVRAGDLDVPLPR